MITRLFLLSHFMFSQGMQGRGRGHLTDSARLSEAGTGYLEKPAISRKGSGKAAYSGIQIQDSKQNKHMITLPKDAPLAAAAVHPRRAGYFA